MQKINRAMRRQMRANAVRIAPAMAATCVDYDPATGRQKLVDHPAAVAELARAFRLLLANGGAVQIVSIPIAAAVEFPAHDPAIIPPGARPFWAVGIDIDGRGAFILCWIAFHGDPDPLLRRQVLEEQMRAQLAPNLARSGFADFAGAVK